MKNPWTITVTVAVLAASLAGCAPNAEFYNTEGMNAFAANDFSRARAAFSEAAELRPEVPSYQYNLGAAYQATGDLDKAIYHYNKAITLHPGLFKAYANMARCYEAQGKDEQLVATYERACASNPMSAVPYYNFALWHLGRGDKVKAEQWLRKAVATNPDDAPAQYLLGQFLIDNGRREEGLRHYQRSREIQPLQPELIETLGSGEPVPMATTGEATNQGSK